VKHTKGFNTLTVNAGLLEGKFTLLANSYKEVC